VLSCGLAPSERINLKEFRMGGTLWRRLAKRPATHRLRVPLLQDSEVSVAVGAALQLARVSYPVKMVTVELVVHESPVLEVALS